MSCRKLGVLQVHAPTTNKQLAVPDPPNSNAPTTVATPTLPSTASTVIPTMRTQIASTGRRYTEPVEQPLDRISVEDEVNDLTVSFGDRQQARAHRGAHILLLLRLLWIKR
jgi:hypothetical protein